MVYVFLDQLEEKVMESSRVSVLEMQNTSLIIQISLQLKESLWALPSCWTWLIKRKHGPNERVVNGL